MAKPAPATNTNTPPSRTDAIASSIAQELSTFRLASGDQADAKQALTNAKGEEVNARELTMGALATVADAGKWLPGEVKAAIKLVIKRENGLNTEKAVQSFMGEAKLAMDPAVRGRFAEIVAVRDAAWDAETENKALDAEEPTPLRDAFKRRYHVLTSMFRLAVNEGLHFADADALVEYALTRDPTLDNKKMHERMIDAMEKLQALYVEFPDADLGLAVDTLGKITVDHFVRARAERNIDSDAPEVDAPAKPGKAKAKAATVAGADTMAEGAVDIDDLMTTFHGGATLATPVAPALVQLAA